MSAETGHIGMTLGAVAVVTGIAGTAMIALGAPGWAWAGFGTWGVLWLTAALGLSDGPSRAFLAGTLRKSNFTQIYTALARRNVMGVWEKLCDPAPDSASLPALFRAALTWRLYDIALRLAVVYPAAFLLVQWVVTGNEGRVGNFLVLPAADFWPDRAIVILVVLISTVTLFGAGMISAKQRPAVRKVAGCSVALAFPFAVILGFLFAGPLTGAVVIVIAFRFAGAAAVAVAVAAAFTGANAVLVAVAVALVVAFAFDALDKRDKPVLALSFLTVAMLGAVLVTATTLDWARVSEDQRSLFLFLAVLPLINALFDFMSYAVTLSLIRRGLRSALPFLWGLADLAVACVLLLGLGATLVAVIHGLNLLAGVPFLDLPALFAGVQADPWAYVWLYAMLFSTLLPTLLHGGLSLLGVQGIWPRALRRPVAAWVKFAPDSPLHAVRASLGLSVIWALPLLLLGAVLWALWHLFGAALLRFLALYLDGLTWIAGGAIGAL